MTRPITLRTTFAACPDTVAIKQGHVTSDRIRFDFQHVPVVTRAFRRMVRTLDFELLHRRPRGRDRTRRRSKFAATVGPDTLSYGRQASQAGIDICLRYAAEQGLVPRVYQADEIFP